MKPNFKDKKAMTQFIKLGQEPKKTTKTTFTSLLIFKENAITSRPAGDQPEYFKAVYLVSRLDDTNLGLFIAVTDKGENLMYKGIIGDEYK